MFVGVYYKMRLNNFRVVIVIELGMIALFITRIVCDIS
jgi:hypothetical protein